MSGRYWRRTGSKRNGTPARSASWVSLRRPKPEGQRVAARLVQPAAGIAPGQAGHGLAMHGQGPHAVMDRHAMGAQPAEIVDAAGKLGRVGGQQRQRADAVAEGRGIEHRGKPRPRPWRIGRRRDRAGGRCRRRRHAGRWRRPAPSARPANRPARTRRAWSSRRPAAAGRSPRWRAAGGRDPAARVPAGPADERHRARPPRRGFPGDSRCGRRGRRRRDAGGLRPRHRRHTARRAAA